MNLKTIEQEQSKALFINKNMLSEYVFPVNQNFSTIKGKQKAENLFENQKYKTLTSSINALLEFPVTSRAERIQTFTSNLTVSQNQNKRPVQQFNRTYYGIYPQKISSKNATMYKRRLTSLDISNVNELNVTSYRNFKINSSTKPSKNNNAIQSVIRNNVKVIPKENFFRSEENIVKQKLPKIQNTSPLKNKWISKIKWQSVQKIQALLSFPSRQQPRHRQKVSRKNSISPWQNFMD